MGYISLVSTLVLQVDAQQCSEGMVILLCAVFLKNGQTETCRVTARRSHADDTGPSGHSMHFVPGNPRPGTKSKFHSSEVTRRVTLTDLPTET